MKELLLIVDSARNADGTFDNLDREYFFDARVNNRHNLTTVTEKDFNEWPCKFELAETFCLVCKLHQR